MDLNISEEIINYNLDTISNIIENQFVYLKNDKIIVDNSFLVTLLNNQNTEELYRIIKFCYYKKINYLDYNKYENLIFLENILLGLINLSKTYMCKKLNKLSIEIDENNQEIYDKIEKKSKLKNQKMKNI